jgi:hypothetical protein
VENRIGPAGFLRQSDVSLLCLLFDETDVAETTYLLRISMKPGV